MKHLKSSGIVIRRVNYGEADKIITVYTRSHGKLRLKAKGIRKTSSKKAGNLELFNHIRLTSAQGRSLHIVTEVATIEPFSALRKNLTKIGVAYHYCELIDRLIPENESHPPVFDLLLNSLSTVNTSIATDILKKEVREFEIRLLTLLGFGVPENQTQRSLIDFIENILEKPLVSRRFLLKLTP